MLRGVVVGESFIVNVLERILAEIPIEFAGCTVVVLPARMASLSQIIEKIEQLLLSDRELTRDIDGASLPVGTCDAFDAAGISASVIIDVDVFDSRIFELTARLGKRRRTFSSRSRSYCARETLDVGSALIAAAWSSGDGFD
jgi:hypothetical protein